MIKMRYILLFLAMVSVLGVSAQTPQYGKPYIPERRVVYNAYSQSQMQMPAMTMHSTGSSMMSTGSTLPIAAVYGTSTTYDGSYNAMRIRRVGEDDGFDNDDVDPDAPANPFPMGDGLWPLMLLAIGYTLLRYRRKRVC